MWILSRMILPKIPLLVQGGFSDVSGRFLQHLLSVWSCVCDLTFLFLPFGVQSLSLLPSAFNSSVDSALLTLIVILLSAFNVAPARFPPCQSTDSVCWSLKHVNLSGFIVVISWPTVPGLKCLREKRFMMLFISLTVTEISQQFSALLCLKIVHYWELFSSIIFTSFHPLAPNTVLQHFCQGTYQMLSKRTVWRH